MQNRPGENAFVAAQESLRRMGALAAQGEALMRELQRLKNQLARTAEKRNQNAEVLCEEPAVAALSR